MAETDQNPQFNIEANPLPADRLPRVWDRKSGLLVMIIFTVLFLLISGLAVLIQAAANGGLEAFQEMPPEDRAFPLAALVVNLVGYAIAGIGTVLLVGKWVRNISPRDIGLRPTTIKWIWRAIALGFGLLIARLVLLGGLAVRFPELAEGAETLAQALFNDTSTLHIVVTILLASFLVPVWEEVFFRGFFHNWLRNRFQFWTAAVLSSLAFGLYHIFPLQIVGAFFLGLGTAWIYEKSGSLWPPIVLHLTNNLVIQGAVYLSALFLDLNIAGLIT